MKKNSFVLTGSSGFLGSIIAEKLKSDGVSVQDINDLQGNFIDITSPFQLELNIAPKTVIHIAGKAHVVPKTEQERSAFPQA